MTRILIASCLTTVFAASVAASPAPSPRQTPPPASQTQNPPAKPPATQTPPPLMPPTPPPAPKPVVPFPADSRIAFVDMQQVVQESKLGKAGQDQMKLVAEKANAELADLNKKVQDKQKEITTQGTMITATALAQKNSELDTLNRMLTRRQEDAQKQVTDLEQNLLENFKEKVLPIVEELAKEKGLYVVFSAADTPGLAYVHPGLDLSLEVIKRLDAKYPGKAPN
jgi:outer membrane protein